MKPLFGRLRNNRLAHAFRGVLDRRIVRNAFALYGAQFANYILPLVMIPYIARVLGPDTWGVIVFIQGIGMYLNMVVNYSFDVSATRETARVAGDREKLSDVAAEVLSARVVLSLGCVVTVALFQASVPALREAGWLLWLGVFWFVAAAFRPFWFFLGLERVHGVLALEVAIKSLAVAMVVWLVNSPADAWKVLAIQGAASAVATTAAMVMVYRLVSPKLPTVPKAIAGLKDGFNLFILQISTSAYTMSNTIILGFLAAPAAVSYYAGAERIQRVLVTMIIPFVQAMYPRASRLGRDDPNAAARSVKLTVLVAFSVTVAVSAIIYFMVPLIIRIALGPGYESAIPVLRILILILPFISITIPLSMHWMVPIGLEKLVTKLAIGGGLFHVPVAIVLGHQFAHIGVAWALVATEVLLLCVSLTILSIRGLNPFWQRQNSGDFGEKVPGHP